MNLNIFLTEKQKFPVWCEQASAPPEPSSSALRHCIQAPALPEGSRGPYQPSLESYHQTQGRIDFPVSNRAHPLLDTTSSLLEITFPWSLGRGFRRENLSFAMYQAAPNDRYFQRTCSWRRITSLQGLYSSALPSSPSWALHQHISMHSICFWKAKTFPARALRVSWSAKWLCLLLKICLK